MNTDNKFKGERLHVHIHVILQTCVSCVVFPDPVSPTIITTLLSLITLSNWRSMKNACTYM